MASTPPLSSSASSFSSSRSFEDDLSSSRIYRSHRQGFRHGHRPSAAATATARGIAFLSAILSALCAGSVTVFSLYGHIFQERLRYSQFQVNGVAIAASISCYLPVPLMGYVCDRVGPAPLSLLSSFLFGGGYGLAALLYKRAASEATAGAGHGLPVVGPSTHAYALMVAAFVCIGGATCAMYLSAVATCAKNFGRGRHRGMALAAPIAAFGLSGMWQSQFGSRVLYERLPPRPGDGPDAPARRGDVDVFAFFLFLAILLSVVGLVGTFTLRVVDEHRLVDAAAEHLERSGVLGDSAIFTPSAPPALPASVEEAAARPTRLGPGASGVDSSSSLLAADSRIGRASGHGRHGTYGTMGRANPFYHGLSEDDDDGDDDNGDGNGNRAAGDGLGNGNGNGSGAVDETTHMLRGRSVLQSVSRDGEHDEHDTLAQRLLDPSKDDDDDDAGDDDDDETEEQVRVKKAWLLNAETHRFLTDHTMWLFALGFFFMIGPGEAFINNMGTVIQTLYPPSTIFVGGGGPTTAATHVSIIGITSTLARLLTGSLTDLLAPRPHTQFVQLANDEDAADDDASSTSTSSTASLPQAPSPSTSGAAALLRRCLPDLARMSISRVAFLLVFALLLSAGLVVLASGAVQGHGDRFWIVSGLVGAGYGAVFSLTPIIITVIWGVENFGTNWGIVAMFPALGATFWGLVYSAVYQAGVESPAPPSQDVSMPGGEDNLCYGLHCYASTFWAMAGSVWVACVLVLLAWKGRNGWSQRGIVI